MKSAPNPDNEQARLEALYRHCILDTPPERVFDELLELAADICKVPVATITLIDKDREWYKSRIGTTDEEAPRNISFCAHTILGQELLIVPDTLKDKRFADNPFVTDDPPLRFYAAFPLITDEGYALGTLCVIDHVPRRLNNQQKKALQTLSRHVVSLLELRRTTQKFQKLESKYRQLDSALSESDNRYQFLLELMVENPVMQDEQGNITSSKQLKSELKQRIENRTITSRKSNEKFLNAFESSPDAIVITRLSDGKILQVNQGFTRLSGYTEEEVINKNTLDLPIWARPEKRIPFLEKLEKNRSIDNEEMEFVKKNGQPVFVLVSAILQEIDGEQCIFSISHDITERKQSEEVFRLESEILSNMTEGFVLTRARDGIIIHTTPQLEEMFGYNSRELIGKHISILNAETDQQPDKVAEKVITVLNEEGKWSGEIKNIKKDGTFFWCYASVTMFEHSKYGTVWLAVHKDITERKKAEKELRFNKFAVEHASDGIYWINPDSSFYYVNEAACKSLGYTRDEILSMHVYDIDPHVSRETWQEDWETIKRDKYLHVESQHRAKNGRIIDIDVQANYIEFEGEEYDCAIVRDITERKRAEKTLLESEVKFSTAFMSSPDAITITSIETGEIIDVNLGFEKISGHSREDVVGKKTLEISCWKDRKDRDEIISQLISNGAIQNRDVEFLTKSGESRICQVSAKLINLDNEQCAISIIRDLTEQKQAEANLQESRRMATTLMDNLPGMVYRCKNDENWTMEFGSQGIYDLTGRPVEEFTDGRIHYSQIIHPDDQQPIWDKVQAALDKRHPFELEYRIYHADGTEHWVWEQGRGVIDDNGQLQALEGFVTDITDRKSVETTLERTHRALSVLSDCNHAMLYATDEQQLLNKICRIIVETGNYRMAWVGYAEQDENKSVRPVAYWGYEKGYIESLNVTWADEARGRGPTGNALRTGKTFIAKNIHTDPNFAPWRKAALARGYASSVAIPLLKDKEVFGALMIYAPEEEAFNTMEMKLLEDLANNISYGVSALRTEIESKQLENALKRNEEYMRFLYQENPTMYFTVASDGTVLSVNEFGAEELGYTVEELSGNTVLDVFSENDHKAVQFHLQKCLENFGQLQEWEIQKVRKNGEKLWVKETARAVGTPDGKIAVLIVCRDITDRRQAEEQLLLHNQSIEAATNAIIITDARQADNPIIYCNPAVERMTGYTRDELLGQNPRLLQGEDHKQPDLKRIGKAIREGHEVRAVLRNFRKDGKLFWNELYLSPVRDMDGNIIYWIGVHNDITEQKQLQDIMQQNDQRLRTAQRIAHLGFWEWNIVTGEAFWSDEVYRIFGFRPKEIEITDKKFLNSVHPDDRAFVEEHLNAAINKEMDYSIDHRIIMPDGEIRYVHEQGEVNYDKTGEPVRMVGTVTDITDRKQTQVALQKNEEQLRLITESVPAIISYIDAKQYYRYYNAAYERYFLTPGKTILGIHMTELLSEESYKLIGPYLEKAFTGQQVNFEFNYMKGDDSTSTFDVTYVPHLDTDNKVVGLYMLSSDITERKQNEEALRRSREKLRNLAARLQDIREEERTHIAREIHDELGQRLTALKMDLSWVANHLPKTWKKLPGRLQSIISLTDSTLEITREMALQLRPAILDDLGLEAAVEWAVVEFSKYSGLDYTLNFESDIDYLDTDRDTAIFRVLQESLTNIARHANATHVDISLKTADSKLYLVVNDNGIGIDHDKSTSSHSLGLIGMRERAGSFGGRVYINNNKNGGTRVRLVLPLGIETA